MAEIHEPLSPTDEDLDEQLAEWFADSEEESADDENFDDEDTTAESDEEVDVPEEEDPDESPARAGSEGGETEPEAREHDPYAWIHEVDPKFRQQVESLVNRDRSNAGRAAALQARLDRLQAERDAERTVAARSAPSQAAPTSAQIADMDDDELKEFMEEYPSVAKSVEKLIERRENKTREDILSQIRPIQQEAEAARKFERKQALRHEASRIFNTAETGIDLDAVLQSERWGEWVAQQPPQYQQYIRTAQEVSDAAKVLEDFAEYANREVYAQYQALEEQRQQQDASHADETAARRQGALRGTTPKSRTAELADRGRSGSFEDYFNEFAK